MVVRYDNPMEPVGGGLELFPLIVLDTHVWVWWVASPEHLPLPQDRGSILRWMRLQYVWMSCWEVSLLVKKGRSAVDAGRGRLDRQI